MSLTALMDHVCRVHRRTETLGDRRETVPGYAIPAGYEELDCTFTRRRTVLALTGGGLAPVGQRSLYLDRADLAWQERDLVEVFEGPEGFRGPQWLEVDSWSAPRGHHTELLVEEYSGPLPEEDAGS